jgi:hypothetical protein
MSGTSTKTVVVSVRLPIAAAEELDAMALELTKRSPLGAVTVRRSDLVRKAFDIGFDQLCAQMETLDPM